jgi:pantoate--beta-alanine ligase
MQIIEDIASLRSYISEVKAKEQTIGFVPTMGALHAGHIALVEASQAVCDQTVVSIFVNPTQFGEGEDFDAYPRTIEEDQAKLQISNVDILYLPSVEVMYPDNYQTTIRLPSLMDGLCGDVRPGHFDGVVTVVTKLLNQVTPCKIFMGEKDYQQLEIIKQLVLDINLSVEVVGVPTVRENDGLAMSSRNQYLSDANHENAAKLYQSLQKAANAMQLSPSDVGNIISKELGYLNANGFAKIDYYELRDATTLQPMNVLDRTARLFVAAFLGNTRLIDNIEVKP